jgi:hypothetical protein
VLSGAAPESVPEAAAMLLAPVSQRLWSRRSKFLLNCVDRVIDQIVRFEIESLLFDNNGPTTCKEAMMGSDFVKMARSHKIRDSSLHEKPSF